jgi:hypothetical protein
MPNQKKEKEEKEEKKNILKNFFLYLGKKQKLQLSTT